LFRVISNEGQEVVYDTSEMSVRTSVDYWCGHPMAKWGENGGEGCMIQSVFEIVELQTVIVPVIT
jgi:hypothetical protein